MGWRKVGLILFLVFWWGVAWGGAEFSCTVDHNGQPCPWDVIIIPDEWVDVTASCNADIKQLADSGAICLSYGHWWKRTTPKISNKIIGVEILDQRTCNLCNLVQIETIMWIDK